MFKFALSTLLSLLIAAIPVQSMAKVSHKAHVTAKRKAAVSSQRTSRKKAALQPRASAAARNTLVRRVVSVHGKRRVIYESRPLARAVAARASPTFGERAGLHLTADPLSLRSNVAFVLDQKNAEELFEKNADVALPNASITKLMTGMIVVQSGQDMDEMLTVTDDDVDHVKFTSSRLAVGSRMTRGALLHIALMSSENRAAAALGRNYPGGLQAFVAAMNAKAQELGMTETHYVDSSGLSSRNVASARDLARLAAAAYQEPLLRQFSTDPGSTVHTGKRMMNYHNTNYLVSLPDWNIGLQKTGFINEAGRCLLMQAGIEGRNVIRVLLGGKGKQ